MIDCTLGLWAPQGNDNLIGATWEPFTSPLPVHEATFVVDYGYDYSRNFIVYVEGGSALNVTSFMDGSYREVCTAAVPQGVKV